MMKKHLVHLSAIQMLFLLHYKLSELNEQVAFWPNISLAASNFSTNLQSGTLLLDGYWLAAFSLTLPLITAITIISTVALASAKNTALPVGSFTTILIVLTINYLIPWKFSRRALSGNHPYQSNDQAAIFLSSKFPPHSP